MISYNTTNLNKNQKVQRIRSGKRENFDSSRMSECEKRFYTIEGKLMNKNKYCKLN